MITVSVNTAILARGISGTARSVGHIARAIESSPELKVLQVGPSPRATNSRVARLVSSITWDFFGAARQARADVHLSPCNVGASRPGQPHVLVMHDTMVLDLPHSFDRGYVAYARTLFPLSAQLADVVITPSRYSAARLERFRLKRPPRVIPWPTSVRASGPKPVGPLNVLMIGVTEPHKRQVLGGEICRLARVVSGADIRLHVIGPEGHAERDLRATIGSSDPAGSWIVRHVGVTEETLGELFKEAWLLLQPSLAEGYGLPVAEASGWAVPTVHSGLGSLSEVSDGGVAADDVWAYVDAMIRLLEPDAYLEASARALGRARSNGPGAFRGSLTAAVREAQS